MLYDLKLMETNLVIRLNHEMDKRGINIANHVEDINFMVAEGSRGLLRGYDMSMKDWVLSKLFRYPLVDRMQANFAGKCYTIRLYLESKFEDRDVSTKMYQAFVAAMGHWMGSYLG